MSTKQSAASNARSPRIAKIRLVEGQRGVYRILLVDDHPLIRDALAVLINRQADLEVCGKAGSAAEAMRALSACQPDLTVTDLNMPGRGGIEFIKDAHAMYPAMLILALSMHDETLYAERALRAGARGYLTKDVGASHVLEVIRRVLGGGSYFSEKLSAHLLDAVTGRARKSDTSLIERLSDREFEVFRLIGRGQTTKEVAQTLNLSLKTIEAHRAGIKRKLELNDASSLIHYAVRWVERHATSSAQVAETTDHHPVKRH